MGKIQYSNVSQISVSTDFPGFSQRLNRLIDMACLGAPPLKKGRGQWLADVIGVSKAAAGDWLTKDKLPKTVTLRKLILIMCSNIPSPFIQSYELVECWVVYGEEVLN